MLMPAAAAGAAPVSSTCSTSPTSAGVSSMSDMLYKEKEEKGVLFVGFIWASSMDRLARPQPFFMLDKRQRENE